MPSFMKFAAAAFAVATPFVSAQTYSDCNPMETTCPANKGLASSSAHFDFTQASSLDQWKISGGQVPTTANGAQFTINKEGDAPTIVSDFYFFYGELSIEMKTSPGQGIVSSAFLQSDDKDEIDWEALGGKTDTVETNYFGKGDTSTYDRETWVPVSTPQDSFHTYTIQWSKESITWLIDGASLRTVNYADAQGGARFPQTPMNIHLGIWAGGAPTNGQGTIDWAGGLTDYSKGPYTMYIKSITVNNANPAESYTWSDKSGSSDSIKFTGSNAVSSRSPTTTDAATVSSSEAASTTESPSTSETPSTTEAPTTTESTSSAPTTLATRTSISSAESTAASSSSAESTAASSSSAESTAASSSGAESTAASSSGAAGASPSGSSSSGSGSGSSSGASPSGSSGSSSSGSGSGSSSSSSPSSSSHSGSGLSSSASASASASPTFNAAASVAATYLGPVSLLGLVTALLQL